MNTDNIPNELKERDQWLMWDSSADTPRRPHWKGDFGVSWTNPDDWHSFEEAAEAAAMKDSWGIGYVFAKGNDDYARGLYGALDLDGCVEDGSPADWLPSLQPFFDEGGYLEYSPSGEGIHIPIAGFELPDWWSDVALDEHVGVEAYEKKFFTFTGDALRGSESEVFDMGDYVVEWLKEAFEEIREERPWEDDESKTTPSSDESTSAPSSSTGNAEEIADAVNRLDARDVADKTIAHGWNENAGHSDGSVKAFYPTWGPSSNGRANIVDEDGWTDTGTDSGSGGPLEMALIDMGELSHSGCEWGDANGKLWWDAVDHLRDLGFNIPEHEKKPSKPTPPEEMPEDTSEGTADGSEDDDDETNSTRGLRSRAEEWFKYARECYHSDDHVDADKGEGRKAAADALERLTDWMYVIDSGKLWVYQEEHGYFDPEGESFIRSLLEKKLDSHYSKQEASEVIERIQVRNQTRRSELNARTRDSPLLCVGNGVVNLETGDRTDHSPEYKFTRGLKWDYDPANADPDAITDFLDDITSREEDRDTLLDHLAHGLMPGHPYRAFVMMYGPGSNGKTRVGKLFRGFVGEENAASVELQDLTGDDSFATGGLPGAFINVGDDISVGEIRDTSIIKSLTGDGTIRANEKYEKQYEFENEAAMFFSANEPPRLSEKTDAINDRLYPIVMPYRFVDDPSGDMEKQKVPGIAEGLLSDEDAMRGLLVLAVKHAQQVIERRGAYSMPEGPAERREMYEAASDPIKRFAIDHLEADDHSSVILKEDAYTVYTEMCQQEGERSASADVFKRKVGGLASIDVESTRTRKLSPGSDREQAWRYIGFAETAKQYIPSRLLARYFPDEEVSDDDTDPDGDPHHPDATPTATSSPVYGATPIAEAADTLTGYVTVTANVAKTMTLGESGCKAILKDETGAMDIVAWDEEMASWLLNMEDESIVVHDSEVREYEGKRQLTVVDGLTEIETIQAGVGYSPGVAPDENQAGLNSNGAVADGGQTDDSDDPDDDDPSAGAATPDDSDDGESTATDDAPDAPPAADEIQDASAADDDAPPEGSASIDGNVRTRAREAADAVPDEWVSRMSGRTKITEKLGVEMVEAAQLLEAAHENFGFVELDDTGSTAYVRRID